VNARASEPVVKFGPVIPLPRWFVELAELHRSFADRPGRAPLT
jgi:hypothetical protein